MPNQSAASARVEMARVLDTSPDPVELGAGRWGSIAREWTHGSLHGETSAMAEHIFMTYTGAARPIARRTGSREVRGRTRRGHVTLIPAGLQARWDIEGSITVVHYYISPDMLRGLADENGFPGPVDLVECTAVEDELGSRLLVTLSEAATGGGGWMPCSRSMLPG